MIVEPPKPRSPLVKVACLKPAADGAVGVYTIDPNFNGKTGKTAKDYARCKLVFDAQPITSEVWRPVEGGHGGEERGRVACGEARVSARVSGGGLGMEDGGWEPV